MGRLFRGDRAPGTGFLQSTPGRAWGFHYESGEPVFLLGDTTYNLFGMAHCGGDVGSFMKRRAGQGFNLQGRPLDWVLVLSKTQAIV